MDAEKRIEKALAIAHENAGIDGSHHKQWVIDQMIRALTGCSIVQRLAKGPQGKLYDYLAHSESDEYIKWVAEFEQGEDGPKSYEWDVGIAP